MTDVNPLLIATTVGRFVNENRGLFEATVICCNP